MMEDVKMFRGAYQFLSNMYAAPFEWDGRSYRNSEAAFQSAKSLDPAVRDTFSEMSGPVAKRAGRKVQLRWDWERVKDDIMEEVVRAKFTQNPALLQKLLNTGDAQLIEGNRWRDSYWGVDLTTGQGENHLGQILMKLRAELGGAAYQNAVALAQEERKKEQEQRLQVIQKEIEQMEQKLTAMPVVNFTGMEVGTKAFGRVTILRQEENRLTFAVNGVEKKFLLPDCFLKGFMLLDDPGMADDYLLRLNCEKQLLALQQEKEKIAQES